MEYIKQTVVLLACLTFVVFGLVVNILQLLFYLVLPRDKFLTVNYYLLYSIYAYIMFLGDWWSGSEAKIYCDKSFRDRVEKGDGSENTVFIMNHHTELDWLYPLMIADRMGVLGTCRTLVKDSLKWVPIVGWAWALSDIIFLRRNWEADQATIAKKLDTLFSYPHSVWLLFFPEGTRFSSEKHKASQDFANKVGNEGLPKLHHHLLPRTKGFSFLVDKINREKVKNIYCVTMAEDPQHSPLTIANVLSRKKTVGHAFIREIPLESIPRDQEGSAQWLMKLYEEKDRLKSSFLKTGSFNPSYPPVCLPPRPWSLLLVVSTNLMLLIPLANHLILYSGWPMRLFVCVLLIFTSMLVEKFTQITQISKASNYGTNGKKCD